MGRHAHPDSRHFWRSLTVATLRALGGLALVVGLFAALSTIGGPPEDGPAMIGEPHPTIDPSTDEAIDASTDEATADDPAPEPSPGPGAEGDPTLDAAQQILAAGPPPEETTVQVLDGVGASPNLPLLVAVLQDLGYRVVATNPAKTDYARTTVLYSEGREDAARALQARHGRIVEVRRSPGLSEAVDLHVVLGSDWQP